MTLNRDADRRRSRTRRRAAVALAATLAGHVAAANTREPLCRPIEIDHERAAAAAVARGGEVLHLRWKLTGFLGFLAGLFLPSSGDALMTSVANPAGRIEVQLLITAPKREGEYYLYGAEIDESAASTRAVWRSYVFRNDGKSVEQKIDEPNVIDFVSAIHHLRLHPPLELTPMTIWSDGTSYPAEIQPLKPGKRDIAGTKMDVRGYEVRGSRVKGQPSFNDKFLFYFTGDTPSTPVEIVGKRGGVRVRIQLVGVEGRALQ